MRLRTKLKGWEKRAFSKVEITRPSCDTLRQTRELSPIKPITRARKGWVKADSTPTQRCKTAKPIIMELHPNDERTRQLAAKHQPVYHDKVEKIQYESMHTAGEYTLLGDNK